MDIDQTSIKKGIKYWCFWNKNIFFRKKINKKVQNFSWKLVLIPHSPWLLLAKIKCQLQIVWKLSYEINWKLTATSNFQRLLIFLLIKEKTFHKIISHVNAECSEHFVSKSSAMRGSQEGKVVVEKLEIHSALYCNPSQMLFLLAIVI